METTFLKNFREFDRSIEKLETNFYHTDLVLNKIENDILNGGKITTPVELVICNGRALLTEGNHRLAVCLKLGITDIPTKLIFKGKLSGVLKMKANRFKPLTSLSVIH